MPDESAPVSQTQQNGNYRVVVFATTDDPHELRDLLVERLSMHPTDAMVLVHATPGILPEHLKQDEAQQLATAIEELGITAEVISQEAIPDFVHCSHVHDVHLLDNGLSILDSSGKQEAMIPWADIEMLSVGQIPGEITRHYHFENDNVLTAARRRYIAPDELAGRATTVLWVLCEKLNKGYRIEKTHMNFSTLGDRMTKSANTNFRLFVEEIATRSTSALLTPATRTFLDHGALRHVQFGSEEELKRYTTFHLILQERLRSM